jgi:hypothetical protein
LGIGQLSGACLEICRKRGIIELSENNSLQVQLQKTFVYGSVNFCGFGKAGCGMEFRNKCEVRNCLQII